ncbi:hypothetical protein MBLNU230_g8039t1 [Neophaeotheca triangularis]
MARATRKRAASPDREEQQAGAQDMNQDRVGGLQMDEALSWRAGKPIPVSELLRRLKALHEELSTMDNEEADRETLVPKAQELVGSQLLDHKDKGIKAYAMLCITQMLALLAPDAPYKESQLKNIFTLFVSGIIPGLSSPSDPYYQQYLSVLNSFVEFKSIMLMLDIPGSETLLVNLFSNCFDVLSGTSKAGSGERVPKNIEYYLSRLLCTLTEDCDTLPNGVIDIILAQFLRADPKTLSSTGNRQGDGQSLDALRDFFPAYNMARSVCNNSAERMTTFIGQYFSSVLLDASDAIQNGKSAGKSKRKKRTNDDSDDEMEDHPSTPPAEHDVREIEKAHRLMRELWRASPDAIQSIVPHLETEMVTENYFVRSLAVQTVGDMIAGIGAAGPPPPQPLDPIAYPSPSLEDSAPPVDQPSVLLVPAAPHAFAARHPTLYQAFVQRRSDRSGPVRAAFAAGIGHVILTSGGGKGLDKDQGLQLLQYMTEMLLDTDEKVRLSAVQSLSRFGYHDMVEKLGQNGGVSDEKSVLRTLADRVKDPSHNVRVAAIDLLARLWGVASGAIAEGSERIRELFGAIPSKLLDSLYVNNRDINATVQRVLYEHLLPVSYPPIKGAKRAEGDSQRAQTSQGKDGATAPDPDTIRVERILTLVRDLDQRARKVFFALQAKQSQNAKFVEAMLQASEQVHSDSAEKSEKEAQKTLEGYSKKLAQFLPDPALAEEHLRTFMKHHDRRSFHLARLTMDAESDYRKVVKAMKEIGTRAEGAPTGISAAVEEVILPVLRWAGVLVYNRSHVPPIMKISNTDHGGLGATAQEVMKEISAKAPEIFKVHVQELCQALTAQIPSAESSNDANAVDTLKACAGFARRFPDDMPKDRNFNRAMVAFALHGSPPKAAKHAVTVIVSSANKKEMYVQEIAKTCIDGFEYGSDSFLTRLAAISQLRLLAYSETESKDEAIMTIAASEVLTKVRTPLSDTDPNWSDEVDEDLSAKLWALKILVNGLRGLARTFTSADSTTEDGHKALKDAATPVYRLLNTLIEREGNISKTEKNPSHHKSRLRLAAATELLKLSCVRSLEPMLTPIDFNRLVRVVQDEIPEVRSSFAVALRKHLGQGTLNIRFYSLAYLYALEPVKETKEAMITWLKARSAHFAKRKEPVIESIFARFLSLLAHHVDFSTEAGDLEDMVTYIMFYLKNAATEASIPPIYSIAQKMKSVQDGINPEKSEHLYVLSDLAEAIIRHYQEIQGWSIQIYPGKVRLPSGLFASLPSHAVAQEISEKRYVPDELYENIEDLVKQNLKTKKRKAESSSNNAAKKAKTEGKAGGTTHKKLPVRKSSKPTKTPKKKKTEEAVPPSERRKSSRAAKATNYAEEDDSEDDAELERQQWAVEKEDAEEEEEEEKADESTPPTSDPQVPGSASPTTKKKQPASSKKKPPARRAPSRRGKMAEKPKNKEKQVMDTPTDSDEELSDAPSDVDMAD